MRRAAQECAVGSGARWQSAAGGELTTSAVVDGVARRALSDFGTPRVGALDAVSVCASCGARALSLRRRQNVVSLVLYERSTTTAYGAVARVCVASLIVARR